MSDKYQVTRQTTLITANRLPSLIPATWLRETDQLGEWNIEPCQFYPGRCVGLDAPLELTVASIVLLHRTIRLLDDEDYVGASC